MLKPYDLNKSSGVTTPLIISSEYLFLVMTFADIIAKKICFFSLFNGSGISMPGTLISLEVLIVFDPLGEPKEEVELRE